MIAALALLAVVAPPPAPAGDPAAPLRAADLALASAVGRGEAEAFAALLEERTIWGSAAGLAEGPQAVLAAWAPFFAPGGPRIAWAPEEAGLAASGDLGWTVGRWTLDEPAPGGGAPRRAEGRYVTVWRRGRDGVFRVLFDMSHRPPAAGAARAVRAARATAASAAGDLFAAAGTYTRGEERGVWLAVERRGPAGPAVIVETEVPVRAKE